MWHDNLIENSKKSVYVDTVYDNIVTKPRTDRPSKNVNKIVVSNKKPLKISGNVYEEQDLTWD